jgi:SAM-dependent methyltransferase
VPSNGSEARPDAAIGYSRVDAQPDAALLIKGMEATARWPAARQLRAWERRQLALKPGERLLDVGCGLGDVAITLASDVAPAGSVVAIDASESMLEVARRRAAQANTSVEFQVGDAQALPFEDGSFEACRSERALQWVPDAKQSFAEMIRVVRPGGRVSVIETDWRTLVFDLPDRDAVAALSAAMSALRGPALDVGGRLLNLGRDLGLHGLEITGAVHVWTRWDPDTEIAPPGLFPIRLVISQMVELGHLAEPMADRFIADIEDAARRDRLCVSLSMVAICGRRPRGR